MTARVARRTPVERALGASLAVLGALFLLAALLRRLNFDEALALRAGWLLIQEIPAKPDFLMPWTLALGALGSLVEDPGTVFLVARLAAVAVVGGAAWWALRQAASRPLAALAATVALAQAAFAVHALEFRYDAAILAGWLVGFGLLSRARPRDDLWLGAVAALLAAHHLKGLFFGLALAAVAWTAGGGARPRGRRMLRLAAGALAAGGAWMALVAARGELPELAGVYATFGRLAGGGVERVAPWAALAEPLARDAAWWLVATAALALTLTRGRRAGGGGSGETASHSAPGERRTDLLAVAFALVPLAFTALHPHPWAYMLALPAPFLALLVARRIDELAPRWPRWAVAAAAAALVALQLAAGGGPPLAVYGRSLAAPRARQVDALRALRAAARPGDRVLDPSGLAYFLPPCAGEWYLDTLFRQRAARGGWMAGLDVDDPAACPWLLYTYRLRAVPAALRERLAGSYVLLPGGLALHRADPRLAAPDPPWTGLVPGELRSFW